MNTTETSIALDLLRSSVAQTKAKFDKANRNSQSIDTKLDAAKNLDQRKQARELKAELVKANIEFDIRKAVWAEASVAYETMLAPTLTEAYKVEVASLLEIINAKLGNRLSVSFDEKHGCYVLSGLLGCTNTEDGSFAHQLVCRAHVNRRSYQTFDFGFELTTSNNDGTFLSMEVRPNHSRYDWSGSDERTDLGEFRTYYTSVALCSSKSRVSSKSRTGGVSVATCEVRLHQEALTLMGALAGLVRWESYAVAEEKAKFNAVFEEATKELA